MTETCFTSLTTRWSTGTVGIGCGWAGPPLAGIVQFADIAIEGMVLNARTYATPDDRDIFTEYGTVIFDGYPFTLSGNERTQLNVGDHVLLFGRYGCPHLRSILNDSSREWRSVCSRRESATSYR